MGNNFVGLHSQFFLHNIINPQQPKIQQCSFKSNDTKLLNLKEYQDDLKACIRGKIYDSEEQKFFYPINSWQSCDDVNECARYRYLLRSKPCSCGDQNAGAEGAYHSIFVCLA